MAEQTVRVRGVKELNKALKGYADDSQKNLREELKRVAAPVAATARTLAAPFGRAVAPGIAPGARTGGAVVRQRRRKTTGHHPEFGGLLMTTALIPALEQHEDQIIRDVNEMFDRLDRKYNF